MANVTYHRGAQIYDTMMEQLFLNKGIAIYYTLCCSINQINHFSNKLFNSIFVAV